MTSSEKVARGKKRRGKGVHRSGVTETDRHMVEWGLWEGGWGRGQLAGRDLCIFAHVFGSFYSCVPMEHILRKQI